MRGNPTWKKGISGNPGGRRAIPPELRQSLREGGAAAVSFWRKILADATEKTSDRNRAAENLMSYAYGKPIQPVDLDDTPMKEIDTKNLTDDAKDLLFSLLDAPEDEESKEDIKVRKPKKIKEVKKPRKPRKMAKSKK